jgi:hypothetical protein
MSILGDDDSLLGSSPVGSEQNYIASLGRISGKLLTADLLRNGQDLTFRNAPNDPDLLYLDVTNNRIGINTDAPLYDLHIDTDVKTTDLNVTNQARIDNIIINADGSFESYTGPIIITSTDINSVIPMSKLLSDYLEIYNNRIDSITNNNIKLIPSGTGQVVAESNVQTYGNVVVQGTGAGNIVMGGNLRSDGTITVGDNILDTVTVNTDFTQSIIPGTDITYDLGKSNKRWAELHSPVWQEIDNIRPLAVRVSDQMLIDGVNKKISGIQSNEDISLNPDTGIVYIENTKWQENDITNLLNTPLTFQNTGIGYVKFVGTNAVLIPAGDIASRPATPEVGDTRWNTELNYLECFDGSVYVVSIGASSSGEVTQTIMEDLGNVWSLVLG